MYIDFLIIQKNRIKQFLLLLSLSLIITFSLFIWYKQYSYRSLKIYTLRIRDESTVVTEQLEIEGEIFQYLESRDFIPQWFKCDYYDAEIINSSALKIYISYRNREDEIYKRILEPGDTLSLDYSRSDIIDIYTKISNQLSNSNSEIDKPDNATNVSIEVNNYNYMNQLKSVVKCLLFFSIIFTLSLAALVYCINNLKLIKLALAIIEALLVFLAYMATYLGWYPYIYIACEYLTVLIGIQLTLLSDNNKNLKKSPTLYEKVICYGIIAMGVIYIIYSQMLNATKGWITYFSAWNQKAVFDYVLLCLLFFVIVFGGVLSSKGKNLIIHFKEYLSTKEFLYGIILIELVLFIPLTSWRIKLEVGTGLMLQTVTILLILGYRYLSYRDISITKTNRKVIIQTVIELVIIVAIVINNIQINYWGNHFGDVYHCNWYYGTLYDIGSNQPFPGGNQQPYGHFALFYKLPMMIFGNSIFVVGVITSILMAVSILCLFVTSHKLINRFAYRIGFDLCLFICFTHNFAYPMNLPHRLLFPSILLLLMVTSVDSLTNKKKLAGYIICMLSVLWSTEVGLICCAIYIIYMLIYNYTSERKLVSVIIKTIKSSSIFLASLIFAYVVVQIYHYIIMGRYYGEYSLKRFLGFMGDSKTMASAQFNTFYFENSQWMYYWIFFIAIFVYGLYKVGLFQLTINTNRNKAGILWCTISAFGLGFMILILSRPEDYTLVIDFILLLAFMIIDRVEYSDLKKKAISMIKNIKILILLPIFILIANILILLPAAINQIKTNIFTYERFDYKAVKRDEKKLESYPIEDIYAVGNGIKMLYLDMGYILENGNGGLEPEGSGQVEELMNETEKMYILTDQEMTNPNYEKMDEIPISNYTYTMYKRK